MMSTTSVLALAAFPAGVSSYIPAQYSFVSSHATGWTLPLAITSSPCEKDVSLSTSAPALIPVGGYETTAVLVAVPTPFPTPIPEIISGQPISSRQVWSPSNSFHVAPPNVPSSSSPTLLFSSSVIIVALSSSALGDYSPSSASVPGNSVVPLPASSSRESWSPSKSFYVVPSPLASSVLQLAPSIATSYTSTPVAARSRTPVVPASDSTPFASALSHIQSQPYIPGVIPSSTPGVIPTYTPGILPSLTPGIVPPPQSNVPATSPSASLSQVPSFVLSLGTPLPSTSNLPYTQASSASPSFSSAALSLASELSSALSSLSRVGSSTLPTSSSLTATYASVSATSSPARSTFSTTTTSAPSSVNAQGTSIPPAPSAGGSSGSLSSRGKERVWWVAFLVPLIALV
ncbi:hypothetical protein DE146DRAFT_789085 [Phaeosphaeria sp. MPI-PUGE-AT-0046c]|nr:hypothetical protein DE146DRAFT_789085 [Phaeosphaeria sp. MPI-PUGE-AT-0046c]